MGDEKEPLSSEEMLRRAREGHGRSVDPDDPAERADTVPSVDAEDLAHEIDLDELVAALEVEKTPLDLAPPAGFRVCPGCNQVYGTNVEICPFCGRSHVERPSPAVDTLRPADGLETDDRGGRLAPTPGPAPSDLPHPPQRLPQARPWYAERWVRIVGAVVLFGAFSLVRGGLFGSSETPVVDIAVGDCFDGLGLHASEEAVPVDSVKNVECAEAHEFEVFAVLSVASDFASFPGEEVLFDWGFENCSIEFERFVGTPYDSSVIYAVDLAPSPESWRDGDRDITCVLYESTDGFEPIPVAGSLRNARR